MLGGRREGGDAPMRSNEGGGGWDAPASAPAPRSAPAQAAPRPQSPPAQQSGGFGDFDDDIPF